MEMIKIDVLDCDNYEEYLGKTLIVRDYVDLSDMGLDELGLNILSVGNTLDINQNQYMNIYGNNLKSLKGCPHYVNGEFDCRNNKLKNLDYTPLIVGEKYRCDLFENFDIVPRELSEMAYKYTLKLPWFVGCDFQGILPKGDSNLFFLNNVYIDRYINLHKNMYLHSMDNVGMKTLMERSKKLWHFRYME